MSGWSGSSYQLETDTIHQPEEVLDLVDQNAALNVFIEGRPNGSPASSMESLNNATVDASTATPSTESES